MATEAWGATPPARFPGSSSGGGSSGGGGGGSGGGGAEGTDAGGSTDAGGGMDARVQKLLAMLDKEEAESKRESEGSSRAAAADAAADAREEELPWWSGVLYGAVVTAGVACIGAYALMGERML